MIRPNLLVGCCVIVSVNRDIPAEIERAGGECREKMDFSRLLERCREGDELAWEALVRQFQARIYGIAYHFVGNAEDARDLAQEAFIRIYQNLSLFPEEIKFLPWVIRITRNACIDHLRRKKARPPAHDIAADEMLSLQASGGAPDQIYAADSRKRMIHAALQQMSDLNREIILLKDIQGLALEEIASLINVPLGTVKSRSNRARIELARRLAVLRSNPAGDTII
jgi:RNA polymerase sigma-70 factor, ECF subfamily